ncbi:MAG: hypothetical protein EOP56_07810 [Sphingobacteriales bacterium]|nr:MAG: hypothetical protein EOP56_07810 [Sphingobacteriales bacterium]
MYYNNESPTTLLVQFRKGAKELIRVHTLILQSKVGTPQYERSVEENREFFNIELKGLYDDVMKKTERFSEMLRNSFQADLDKSYLNYLNFYTSRFLAEESQA